MFEERKRKISERKLTSGFLRATDNKDFRRRQNSHRFFRRSIETSNFSAVFLRSFDEEFAACEWCRNLDVRVVVNRKGLCERFPTANRTRRNFSSNDSFPNRFSLGPTVAVTKTSVRRAIDHFSMLTFRGFDEIPTNRSKIDSFLRVFPVANETDRFRSSPSVCFVRLREESEERLWTVVTALNSTFHRFFYQKRNKTSFRLFLQKYFSFRLEDRITNRPWTWDDKQNRISIYSFAEGSMKLWIFSKLARSNKLLTVSISDGSTSESFFFFFFSDGKMMRNRKCKQFSRSWPMRKLGKSSI